MKHLKLLTLILTLVLLSLLLIACKGTEVTIGENGNWYLDGEDSGVSAKGEKGDTGEKGEAGADGISPQIRINSATNKWEISTDGGKTWTSTNVNATGAAASGGSASTDSEDGFEYLAITANSYGVKAGDALYMEEIVIPATYRGKPVTQILPNAFSHATNLKKITIPAGIEKMGEGAFTGCDNLEAVYISDLSAWYEIEFDGTDANPLSCVADLYLNNSKVTTLTVPATVKKIQTQAFKGCTSLTGLSFASGSQLTEIGNNAFSGCTALASASLPTTLQTIGAGAFYQCSALTSITIPASVTSLGDHAFAYCAKVTALNYNATALTHYPLSSSPAFLCIGRASTGVTVNIGANVTKIPGSLFAGTEYLGDYQNIKSVVFAGNSQCTEVGNGAFRYCEQLTSVSFGTNGKLQKIGTFAFAHCKSLTGAAIPAKVTLIGEYAFYQCAKLATLSFGTDSLLTSIGKNAFSGCTLLQSVSIPAQVTLIGEYAFYNAGLTSASFANKTGWSLTSTYGTPTTLTQTQLSDTATAAEYLVDTYYTRTWTRS